MNRTKSGSRIDTVAAALRKIALGAHEGEQIGGEESLIDMLRTSRATLRQAARVVESEGLLKVRRGISGGYFATRPSFNSIEYAFAANHESVHPTEEDITEVSSLLWVEAVRRAARLRNEETRKLVERFVEKVAALRPDTSWDDVYQIERDCRKAIFDLVRCRFVEVIFNTTIAFSYKRGFPNPVDRDETSAHREFVRTWREMKTIELQMIAAGDQEMAMMAARRLRSLWHRRVWGRDYRQAQTASSA